MRSYSFPAVLVFFLQAAMLSGEEVIRVACVGDSITFGAGVENRGQNNYPKVLGRLLGAGYETRNFGVNGATLLKKGDKPYWKTGAFKAATGFKPHIVIVKLGTNDSKPQNWKHKGQYATDLDALAYHFASLPTRPKIWLCKPAPVYRDRWGINEKAVKGEVIPLLEGVAKKKKLPIIDLYKALSGIKQHFPDGIHPNAKGAEILARAVYQAIKGKAKRTNVALPVVAGN
ncbi:MAG: GDSL-type esterase/lipase family protein [Planctomycetes bacterium]|nr:GDSL-type esterase/lipase family protein [Planctomycetota bacterium]